MELCWKRVYYLSKQAEIGQAGKPGGDGAGSSTNGDTSVPLIPKIYVRLNTDRLGDPRLVRPRPPPSVEDERFLFLRCAMRSTAMPYRAFLLTSMHPLSRPV